MSIRPVSPPFPSGVTPRPRPLAKPAAPVHPYSRVTADALEPTVSGGPGSLLPLEPISLKGRQFLAEAPSAAVLRRAMGGEVVAPKRVYGSPKHAADPRELARKMVEETRRLGGFDNPIVLISLPTGSGNVNGIWLDAIEALMGGRVTTLTPQWNDTKSLSWKSVRTRTYAIEVTRELQRRVNEELRSQPPEKRSKVVFVGESFAAWHVQDAWLKSTAEQRNTVSSPFYYDRALFFGSPGPSKFHDALFGDGRTEVAEGGLSRAFSGVAELREHGDVREVKTFFVAHDFPTNDDPVARVDPKMILRKPPDWPHGEGAPRWWPVLSFVKTVRQLPSATVIRPGQLTDRQHDYSADIPEFIRALIDFPKPLRGARLSAADLHKALDYLRERYERRGLMDAEFREAEARYQAELRAMR